VIIRKALSSDVPGLVHLWTELMDHHADVANRFVRTPDATDRWAEYITPRLEDRDTKVLVAEEDGVLVGYLVALIAEYPPIVEVRQFGFIQEILVTESHRRRGIAHELFTEAEQWLMSRGLPHVELRIDSDNTISRRFWEQEGFGPHTENLIKRYH
jgi:GNAT superfamily N-acetyltransferase